MTSYKFTALFLGSAQSLFGTNSDHGSWKLFQSSNSCEAAFGVEILTHICQITSTAWMNSFATFLLQLQKSNTFVKRKTRVGSKTSKTIPASWLAPNLKQVPLVMKCQVINNEKSLPQHKPVFPWESWRLPKPAQLDFCDLPHPSLGRY